MNRKVYPVTFSEFLSLLHTAQQIHKASSEPIPNMWPDNQAKVESCLLSPFHTFEGRLLIKGFLPKAVALFYSINKNHSLENGNKRMSILVLAFFCAKNGRELDMSDE